MCYAAGMKKVFFLGQAPPRIEADKPFGRTALYKWLEGVGVRENEEYSGAFGALIDFYPGSKNGSHLAPTPQQILDARPVLVAKVVKTQPDVLVPIGILAIREVLQEPKVVLENTIGKVFHRTPLGLSHEVPVIPLPHPSGANPWVHLGNNRLLLDQALKALKGIL